MASEQVVVVTAVQTNQLRTVNFTYALQARVGVFEISPLQGERSETMEVVKFSIYP